MKRLVKYWFGAVIASVRLGLPAKPTRVLVGSHVPLPSAQQWMSALVKSPMALIGVPGVFFVDPAQREVGRERDVAVHPEVGQVAPTVGVGAVRAARR